MAKRAKGSAVGGKTSERKPEAPTHVQARVVLEVGADVPSYYVNFADIAQSSHEFTISVGKTQSRLSAQQMEDVQKTGQIRVEAILQLVIPPTLLPSLINAMTIQKDLYEKMHGPLRDGAAVPVLGQETLQ
jgi:hypothetical protein